MKSHNIILTGIPRSGTTLLTALVDGMDNSVALNEPAWQFEWLQGKGQVDPQAFTDWLVADFARIRRDLLHGVPVPERRKPDGSAVTNYHRLRQQDPQAAKSYTFTDFTRPGLTPEFTLAMKHIGPYMGALEHIVATGAFTIIAVVRNPIGVIASWNEVPIPVGQGKMPGAAVQWRAMAELTARRMPLLEKQVRLYDLLCQRLYELRADVHTLTYESLVENPAIIEPLIGKKIRPSPALIEKREIDFYRAPLDDIRAMVKKVGEYARFFYPEC